MPINPEWVVQLKEKKYVLFPGLLHLAHQSGLRSIETELVQIPNEQNGMVAIIKASATFAGETGDAVWSAYGDASPRNVNRMMMEATIRLAETRAIGRVLRMSCDVGETMLEELADVNDEMGSAKHPNGAPGHGEIAVRAPQSAAGAAPAARATDAPPAARGGGEEAAVCIYADCGQVLTKNQLMMSQHKLRLKLCPAHLKLMLEEQKKAQAAG